MANKQNPQILSPENYIRQRVRNLPLYKSYINDDWEESGLAQITITRKHINGNLTFCSYMVDVKCLGIKDTFYDFNIPEEGLEEFLDKQRTILNIVEVDYNLVHNIIHAAWEFADEIGFKPYKDFLTTTQYMLEEDTDDIPIINIYCGDEDGKPLYIQGPWEDKAKANSILNHLEKHVGKGNYHFIMAADEELSKEVDEYLKQKDPDYEDWKKKIEDEDWDEDEEDHSNEIYEGFFDEYSQNSFEENKELFLELLQISESAHLTVKKEGEGQSAIMHQLQALSDLLYMEMAEEKDILEWLDKWKKEDECYQISHDPYNQMIGLPDDYIISDEEISILQSDKEVDEVINLLRMRWGDVPFLTFLEVEGMEPSSKRAKIIAKKLKEYPDNSLLKMEDSMEKMWKKKLPKECIDFESTFGSRTLITPFEYYRFQMMRLTYFLSIANIAGIQTLHIINDCDDMKTAGDGSELYNEYLTSSRITLLRIIFQKKIKGYDW